MQLRVGMRVKTGALHFQKFIDDEGLSDNFDTAYDYVMFRHRHEYKDIELQGEIIKEAFLDKRFLGKWFVVKMNTSLATYQSFIYHESELIMIHPFVLQDEVYSEDGRVQGANVSYSPIGRIVHFYKQDTEDYANVVFNSSTRAYPVSKLRMASRKDASDYTLTEWLDSLHLLS